MLVTRADFPIDGRAAMMMRLPGWKPPVSSSRSLKPDGVPVIAVPSTDSRCSLSSSSCRTSSIERKSFWRSSCATSSMARSACSTSSRGAALRSATDAWISYVALSIRRSSACSRTMRAYWRTLPAAGTPAVSSSTVPAASPSPSDLSRSVTVRTSIGSLSR